MKRPAAARQAAQRALAAFDKATDDRQHRMGMHLTEKEAKEAVDELKKVLATAKVTVEKPDTKDK